MLSDQMLNEVIQAFFETLYMVIVSGTLAVLFGFPLGLLLFATKEDGLNEKPYIFQVSNFISNVFRSIPFVILLALLIPVTRFIVGSSIGSSATIVPLTIGAIPFFAKLTQNVFEDQSQGLIDAGIAMGATTKQILFQLLLPESLPALINAITVTLVALVSYSAMAGAVGGGGLGALAIDYGYQRFELAVLLTTVAILVLLVQIIQYLGDKIASYFSH